MGKWEWGSHFNPTIMRIIGILSVEYLWGIISHHFSNVSLGGGPSPIPFLTLHEYTHNSRG